MYTSLFSFRNASMYELHIKLMVCLNLQRGWQDSKTLELRRKCW